MRIVSLLPSATEIAYALGLEQELVGVTFECDEPARARHDKRIVVGGRDTSTMAPGEIDAWVRSQADPYTLDADALRDLDPDVVLTQDLCRVCALPSDRVDEALAFLGCTADVVSLDPHSLDDVLASIEQVGTATGRAAAAAHLVTELRARLARIAAAVAGRPRPRVAVLEWTDPPYASGHWVPDLVTAAGGTPVLADPGGRSVPTTWEALRTAEPDVVVVAPCGYDLEGAATQARTIEIDVPVWAVDANGLIVRPGPRVVDGVAALAYALHGIGDPQYVTRVR